MNQSQSPRSTANTGDERPSCPPPIVWQDVLAAYRAESQPFEVSRGRWIVRGRAWGSGPPLYFLNGVGGTHELYASLVWLLRDRFRCTVMDYRVPARPGWHSPPLRMPDLADDLLAVAAHQGDRDIDLYATSFGVPVALHAMLAEPHFVNRAVLQGGFAHLRLSLCERLAARWGRWVPGRLRHVPLRRRIQRASHANWFPLLDRGRLDFFLENSGDVPIAWLAARSSALIGHDLRPNLSRISQPVMVLSGEGDGRVRARSTQELAAGLPRAQADELHSCGHLPFLTHPHRVAAVLRAFLAAPAHSSSESCASSGSCNGTVASETDLPAGGASPPSATLATKL